MLESRCFSAGEMSRQLGLGRGQGVQGDWDVRLGGNGLRDQECTPDLDERSSSGNPRPSRVSFAPGVCSTPMPRGESVPFNVTRCGKEEMSLTQGALRDQSHDAPGFEQFFALIRERQGILEGVVERMRGELVQVQGNVSQEQGDLGTMNRRVDSLGQDVGALRGDIGTLESNVTSQLGSIDRSGGTQLSNITQMLAGLLGGDKPQPAAQPQEVGVAGNQPAISGSQGSPCPPGPVSSLSIPADRPTVS